MRLEQVETMYRQVREDVDEEVLARHVTADYVGAPHRTVGGRVDVRCSDVGTLDLLDSHVGGNVYAWHLTADRADLTRARVDGDVNFRDAVFDRGVSARNISVLGDVSFTDAAAPYVDLSGSKVFGTVDAGEVDSLDLSGAAAYRVADNPASVTVDEDTYLHEVSDDLAAELGYRQVTDLEWRALSQLATGPVSYDELRERVKPLPQYVGAIGSLTQKGFVETVEERYALTDRGESAVLVAAAQD